MSPSIRSAIASWVSIVVALVVVGCDSSRTCDNGLAPLVNGECPIRCVNSPTRRCYADGGEIPDAEPLDAAGYDVAPECGANQTTCAGACVDTSSDPTNCGGCGRACPQVVGASATCAMGTCGFACVAGHHQCGGACLADDSPQSCGALCTPCAVPANGSATCVSGACGIACAAGFEAAGATCDLPVPRAIAPLSGAVVLSRTPTLRWVSPAGVAAVVVEMCTDGDCTGGPVMTFESMTDRVTIPSTLLPRVWFWRLRSKNGTQMGTRTSPAWEFGVTHGTQTSGAIAGWRLDFNRDGLADAVVAHADFVSILHGQRVGFLSDVAREVQSSDRTFPTAGDVNGDGVTDLVIGSSDGIQVFSGADPSSVATQVVRTGSGLPTFVGDIDGDGYGDIIAAVSDADSHLEWLRGSADGLSVPITIAGTTAPSSERLLTGPAIDFDGDGTPTLLVEWMGSDLRIVDIGPISSGTTPFDLAVVPFDMIFASVRGGDVDGDGFPDLLVGDSQRDLNSADSIQVVFGGSGSAPTRMRVSDPNWSSHYWLRAARVGDIAHDGRDSIGVISPNHSLDVYAIAFDRSVASRRATMPLPGSPLQCGNGLFPNLGAADLNGDGAEDLVIGCPSTSGIESQVLVIDGATITSGATPARTIRVLDLALVLL